MAKVEKPFEVKMKKHLILIMIAILAASALLAACSPKTPVEVVPPAATGNQPAAEPTGDTAPESPDAPANPSMPMNPNVATAYPALPGLSSEEGSEAAYPVDGPGSLLTDEQILELITMKLDGHHEMDFLLSQNLNHDQWVEVLSRENHKDVDFSPWELEQVIAYLIANKK